MIIINHNPEKRQEVYVHNIECMTAENCYQQEYIMNKMLESNEFSRKSRLYIKNLYKQSGIDKRHLVSDIDTVLRISNWKDRKSSTAKMRNQLFNRKANDISVRLVHGTIQNCPGVNSNDITDVITVSCTGLNNPGNDCYIIESLNLSRNIQRYNICFMGCYGAFPGMRLAQNICKSNPDAVVLILCVEFCSIHFQLENKLDSIRSASIFGDGAACAIVSSKPPITEKKVFILQDFEVQIIENTSSEMSWTIGNSGFEMTLSKNIPKIIEANTDNLVMGILNRQGLHKDDIQYWALHPGGKTILDALESKIEPNDNLSASRDILKNFGNMSSVTIFFVLKQILESPCRNFAEPVVAMAFGPGLTVETALLSKTMLNKTGKKLITPDIKQLLLFENSEALATSIT